jgi:hypothetical protein
MPISDHASEGLSRKAKRLDSPERRGTLAHAKVKASLSLSHPLIFPRFKLAVLGLDIDCRNLDLEQRFLLILKWIGHLGVALPGKESADPF